MTRLAVSLKTLIDEDRCPSSAGLELNKGYSEDIYRHSDEKRSTIVGWDGSDDPVRDSFTIHKDASNYMTLND